MIYDALEQVYTVIAANFATHHAALLTAKSVTAPAAATIIKRQNAETSRNYGTAPPTLGITAVRATTGARHQLSRDTTTTIVCDYLVQGTDPGLLAAQAELAVEALLRSVDALPESGGGVYGAGEFDDSISITMSDGYTEDKDEKFWHRGQVSFPVHDRDTGL